MNTKKRVRNTCIILFLLFLAILTWLLFTKWFPSVKFFQTYRDNMNRGAFRANMAMLDEAIERDMTNAELYLLRANLYTYMDTNNYIHSIGDLEKALDLDPSTLNKAADTMLTISTRVGAEEYLKLIANVGTEWYDAFHAMLRSNNTPPPSRDATVSPPT